MSAVVMVSLVGWRMYTHVSFLGFLKKGASYKQENLMIFYRQ
ncbi:hypothetical protein RchiOBHm_Chr2g0124351 [Rosa chinensis]|uniref:Uncharacterized protein n=1 Tax=Rosa chinensis TaxID=74649 RepID=A0A2P6RT95_ROSCH|nr:hypothetical protein RchiOBHm_Chr2g0124351 [Rosa chinensis]